MASSSIFRSFTLPNGSELKTMREDVRNTALQAVKDRNRKEKPATDKTRASTPGTHSERFNSSHK